MKEIIIIPTITPRDSYALTRYFNDIKSNLPLTPEQEVELAVRIQHGDTQARDELVKANLRFVVSVAKQYNRPSIDLIDLINEGNIGLIQAAERYDPTYGFKFDSYAIWWIRRAISASLNQVYRTIRIPASVTRQMSILRKAQARFEQKYERLPSKEELSELVDMHDQRIQEIQDCYYRAMSLDTPITDDSDSTWADIFPSYESADEELMRESVCQELEQRISTLPKREQKILQMYFGLNGEEQSLDMIAYEMGLSRERVRQLREHALRTLRMNYYKKHHSA